MALSVHTPGYLLPLLLAPLPSLVGRGPVSSSLVLHKLFVTLTIAALQQAIITPSFVSLVGLETHPDLAKTTEPAPVAPAAPAA